MPSKIEWTEETWNVVVGCTRVSAGCDHCYAIREAHRLAGNPNGKIAGTFEGLTTVKKRGLDWTGDIVFPAGRMTQPLHWRTPRRVFVNSMADLFHPAVPDEMINRIFGVMALCPQHTFQILTKRPERMKDYINSAGRETLVWIEAYDRAVREKRSDHEYHKRNPVPWPLPNVWLGVSVENEDTAEERLPLLQQLLAAVRFVSYEPALGPVDWERWLQPYCPRCRDSYESADGQWAWLAGELWPIHHCDEQIPSPRWFECRPAIDWVICGGESGSGARPMHIEWARSARDQCVEHGIPFFFKQFGEWAPGFHHSPAEERATRSIMLSTDGDRFDGEAGQDLLDFCRAHRDVFPFYRWGKKVNGRLLDGREWSQFPTPRTEVAGG